MSEETPAFTSIQTGQHEAISGHQFGTFAGVFTPSILTILGVVMFMSTGIVVGHAGIIDAIIILMIAKSITTLTSLSIAAISTNTPVKGGGAYFLISRSLGPESGGAIGLTLFLAQALSVPFYILGFTEALCIAFPSNASYFFEISIATTFLLFLVNLIGATWAIRLQYIILATLVFAMIIFMGGALTQFNLDTFNQNLDSAYYSVSNDSSFWNIFAIYFPAVTGIMTGVNMSGDLKNPAVAIPRGTFLAIFVGFLVYLVEIIICGGAQTRDQLNLSFHQTLLDQALFGMKYFVVAGVFAASLSSALGSLLGAPRILQALARDNIFKSLRFFGKGRGENDEPIRGLWMTLILSISVLYMAHGGNNQKDDIGALNYVGSLLTMFFLYAYGMTNIAAFAESFTRNPSFRPRFRFFHWSTALLGALSCLFTTWLIHWEASLLAMSIIIILFFYVKNRVLSNSYGDVRRGFYYTRVRENLLKLNQMPHHPKNWRPNTLILSGNPHSRLTLTQYALWLSADRGVATLVEILEGSIQSMKEERQVAQERLQTFIEKYHLKAFHEVLIAPNFDQGLLTLLQCHAIGAIKPNLVMLGWPNHVERFQPFVQKLNDINDLNVNAIIAVDRGLPKNKGQKRIDIWWRGQQNGSLMIILAYLLSNNLEWARHEVRVLRAITETDQELVAVAQKEIEVLLEKARINGKAHVVQQRTTFQDVLHQHSHDAAVVFLGFRPPQEDTDSLYHYYADFFKKLPTTLLVSSVGDADLLS